MEMAQIGATEDDLRTLPGGNQPQPSRARSAEPGAWRVLPEPADGRPRGLDDDGFGVHGIARLALIPATFTLSGKLEYVFRDELQDELVVGVDADYRFLPQLSAFVSYEVYDELDNDLLVIGGRLNF